MLNRRRTLALSLCWIALGQTAHADVIVPNASAATAGNQAFNGVLLNMDRTYQMQIAASQLAAIPVGHAITGLTWRTNVTGSNIDSVASTFANWNLTLAQATNPMASMSVTFANNMTNPLLVRSGPLSVADGAFPGGANPNPFGPTIAFTTPYVYQGGDLVVHLTFTAGTAPVGLMDSFTFGSTSDGYGTLFRALRATEFNATTGTPVAFIITRFSVAAIP